MNSSGINKVFLVGHIDNDPEWQLINNCNMLCFTLITSETIKKNGSSYEHMESHEIKIPSGYVNENIGVKAGDMVYIQGRLQTSKVVSDDNVKLYKTEILAQNLEVLHLSRHTNLSI